MGFQKQVDTRTMTNNSADECLRKDFMQGKPINNSYPIELANGAEIVGVATSCIHCGVVPHECFRGTVTILNNGNTAINQAVGHCETCLTLWPVIQRLKSDNNFVRVEFFLDGKWTVKSTKDSHSYLTKAAKLLKSIFFVFNSK